MTILCRFGELTLKGNNRSVFERQLIQNIKRACKRYAFSIKKVQARLFIEADRKTEEMMIPLLQRIFGLMSVSLAISVPDEAGLHPAIDAALLGKDFATFRITVQRLNKIGKTSEELERSLGEYVQDKYVKKVRLKQYDLEISVEVIDRFYIFTDRLSCVGGLPLGIEGTVLAVIRDASDVYAAWLMMKRGCIVVPVALLPEHPDVSLLSNYHNPIPLQRISDIKEVALIAQKYSALAVVQGLKELNLPDMVTFRPLAAMGYDEVERNVDALS